MVLGVWVPRESKREVFSFFLDVSPGNDANVQKSQSVQEQ